MADINGSPKGIFYKQKRYPILVDHFTLRFYLSKPISSLYKKQISRIRLSSHNLAIESGRPNDICRGERVCEFCKSSIQDEFHFVIICPLYNDLRMKYLKKNQLAYKWYNLEL